MNLNCCFVYTATGKLSMQIISLADLNVFLETHFYCLDSSILARRYDH